mmetsp:Transcript_8346/g.30792  ORF Transcript_8346/g.30792 Transcript_8346/m.30792 type:complete len:208 (+) Transcript_8346:386-1009(+)
MSRWFSTMAWTSVTARTDLWRWSVLLSWSSLDCICTRLRKGMREMPMKLPARRTPTFSYSPSTSCRVSHSPDLIMKTSPWLLSPSRTSQSPGWNLRTGSCRVMVRSDSSRPCTWCRLREWLFPSPVNHTCSRASAAVSRWLGFGSSMPLSRSRASGDTASHSSLSRSKSASQISSASSSSSELSKGREPLRSVYMPTPSDHTSTPGP